MKKPVKLSKRVALANWRELKDRLRRGEIRFEDYAVAKRKLKPFIESRDA